MPKKKIARKVTQSLTYSPQRKRGRMAKSAAKMTDNVTSQFERLDESHLSTQEVSVKMRRKSARNSAKESVETPIRGRKRKRSESETNVADTSHRRSRKLRLLVTEYMPGAVGNRVLSCGEGDQLGHPNRTTTRKPRAIDAFPEDSKIVQVVAGGVHSLVLFENGSVFTCGINEKGAAPGEGVEAEGSSDRFNRIIFSEEITEHGKIVMLTAGASFSAALTDKGSVIAWGSLRDTSGCIESHRILLEMEERPVVVIKHQHKAIVKIDAGENHLVMLSQFGELLTFGDGSMGQLGRSVRVGKIRSQHMVDDTGGSLLVSVMDKGKKNLVVFDDIMAGGYWTAAKSVDDRFFVCGLNNFGQLGIKPPDLDQSAQPGAEGDDKDLKIMRMIESKTFSSHRLRHLSGVQHIITHDELGNVYGIGKNTDNALGLGTWKGKNDGENWRYTHLEKIHVPNKVVGVSAKLCSSVIWTEKGDAYSWGYDTCGQLGLGIKDEDDEKTVAEPRLITSAHLNGYRIINASIADNHTLFLATNN